MVGGDKSHGAGCCCRVVTAVVSSDCSKVMSCRAVIKHCNTINDMEAVRSDPL
jgi:hypothetical protein